MYFGYLLEPYIEILCFIKKLFQILAPCFQKLIALAKKKLSFFLAMQNFAPGKKG
jgi:hypothetical protein